jgi:hypothetical protein
LVILALVTLFFRWIWNITMPEVFCIKTATFWQAFRIMIHSTILFGGGTRVVERGNEILPDDNSAQVSG